jgi:hypothetical protein
LALPKRGGEDTKLVFEGAREMAPALESDLMGHLFDRWTSGLAQKIRRFSYPKIMDEIHGCGAECFPETLSRKDLFLV